MTALPDYRALTRAALTQPDTGLAPCPADLCRELLKAPWLDMSDRRWLTTEVGGIPYQISLSLSGEVTVSAVDKAAPVREFVLRRKEDRQAELAI